MTGAVQCRLRTRLLRTAAHYVALAPDVAVDLARWSHRGGFSLHAAVRLEAEERASHERLLRYCTHPAFACEQFAWDGPEQPDCSTDSPR